jgi:tyrosyl-tRNA synthetase
MSIPDSALEQWYLLLLGRAAGRRRRSAGGQARARTRADCDLPRRDAAEHEAAEWDRVQRGGGQPSEIEEASFTDADGAAVHLPALIGELFGLSTSEARRLIEQGAVSLDDVRAGRTRSSSRSASTGVSCGSASGVFVRLRRAAG